MEDAHVEHEGDEQRGGNVKKDHEEGVVKLKEKTVLIKNGKRGRVVMHTWRNVKEDHEKGVVKL